MHLTKLGDFGLARRATKSATKLYLCCGHDYACGYLSQKNVKKRAKLVMCSKTPRVSHLKPSKATPFLSEVGSQGLPFLVKALSMESHGPHELSSSRTCDRFRNLLLTCINHYKY